MNVKNKPPVIVPVHYRSEMEKLSKAALMDMLWYSISHDESMNEPAIDTFRSRRDIVSALRSE